MKTILKYELKPGKNVLQLPLRAVPIHVAIQTSYGVPDNCIVYTAWLWARVDTSYECMPREFEVVATGEEVVDHTNLLHIGTAVSDAYVWHVFERLPALTADPDRRRRF
jgi:hypothetical protein